MSGKGAGSYPRDPLPWWFFAFIIAIGVFVLWMFPPRMARAADPIALASNGVTCADVKKLTTIERRYWIWRLGLTPQQVAAIKAACRIK